MLRLNLGDVIFLKFSCKNARFTKTTLITTRCFWQKLANCSLFSLKKVPNQCKTDRSPAKCGEKKFVPKISANVPRNTLLFPRIGLLKSHKVLLFSATYQKPHVQDWTQVLFNFVLHIWQGYLTFSYYFIFYRIVFVLVTFYQRGHSVMPIIRNMNLIGVQSWTYLHMWKFKFSI